MPAKKTATRKVPATKATKKPTQFKPYKSLWRRLAWPLVGLFAVIATALVINGLAATYKAGFVYRGGKNLMLNGAPYKFVGFNAYGMAGCETGTPWSQAQVDEYFRSLPPASVTRIWAFKQRSSNLDMVVARAEAHGQKLVMTLGNGLRNCENGTFYFVDGPDPGDSMGTAWFQSTYKGEWTNWVKTAVAKYKDSPAVGMWEVSNEGGHNGSSASVSEMKSYYDTVAGTIKNIDPQHLVSTGALAEYTYGGEAGYQSIHSGSNIDVVSFHEYDGGTLSNHFPAVMRVANNLNKPLMVGEVGDPWKESGMLTGQAYADFLKKRLDGYLAGGAAGVLPWNYGQGNYSNSWSIFPGSPTATMVSNYKVPGGVVVSPIPTPTPTAPAVNISAPANNATVSGTQTVTANATDTQGLKSVQFKLNGNNLGAADTTAPYSVSWDTKTANNGTNTLTAVATNTSNLSTTSGSVSVTVSNQTSTPKPVPTPTPTPTQPTTPATDMTAPTVPGALKATRVTRNSVTLRWNASTDAVGVVGYRVYRDGQKIADQSSTSLIIYGLKSNKKYTFTVQAYDAAGNASAKAQVVATTHKAPRRWYWWW
jgi:hypothetical protein